MSAVQVIVAERCHYCWRQYHPGEILHLGVASMCRYCYRHHLEAMQSLITAAPPKACQQCNTPFSDLAEKPGGAQGDVEMLLVVKDAIYQLLCRPCAGQYVRKRPDLYGHGPFGRKMGLN